MWGPCAGRGHTWVRPWRPVRLPLRCSSRPKGGAVESRPAPMPRLAELLGSEDIEGVRSMGCEDACEPAVDAGRERTAATVGGTGCGSLLFSSPCVLAGAEAVAAGKAALVAAGSAGLLGACSFCCTSCAAWLGGAFALLSSRMLARSGAFCAACNPPLFSYYGCIRLEVEAELPQHTPCKCCITAPFRSRHDQGSRAHALMCWWEAEARLFRGGDWLRKGLFLLLRAFCIPQGWPGHDSVSFAEGHCRTRHLWRGGLQKKDRL